MGNIILTIYCKAKNKDLHINNVLYLVNLFFTGVLFSDSFFFFFVI